MISSQLGAIHIKHRFNNTKDIRVFRHIIILITVLCIGKKREMQSFESIVFFYLGGFPYSMLMVLNTQSIAPFSMYRVCITIFSLSVTADMGAILFFNKNVRTIFFNCFQGKSNRIGSIPRG